MPMSDYIRELRELVGTRVLCLPAVTGLIQDDTGRILLVQPSGFTTWSMPGGMIEPGERPAATVVREMHEELGIEVKPVSLLGVFGGPEYFVTYPHGDQVNYITSVFRCEILKGEFKADGDELSGAMFVATDDFTKFDVEPWVQRVLRCVSLTNQGGAFEMDDY